MERSMYEWCRRKFIKAALRREHQRRMDFDCNLRMQQQVRCGRYHAIRWPDDFTWSIWHEGNRGYLVQTTMIKFVNLSAAIEFIREKSSVMVSVAVLIAVLLCPTALAQKVYQTERSTAILQVKFQQDEGLQSAGSCVMVDATHALTAAHVVGSSEAVIKANDGDVAAKVVAIDLYHDRALLRADREITTKWRVLREDMPVDGETVFAIGFGGRGYGYTRGQARGGKLTGSAIPGDSGGPVCDQQGRVVGIITGYSPDGHLVSLGRRSLRNWVLKNLGNEPMQLGSKE